MSAYESTVLEAAAAFRAGDWSLGLYLLEMAETSIKQITEESRVNDARNRLRVDYNDTVEGVSNEVAQEWRSGGFQGDRDSMIQSIEESCDARCTYTTDCQQYLMASNNDTAYVDNYGELPSMESGFPWGALASAAMRQDVFDDLKNRLEIDVDKDPPSEPSVNCETCGEWGEGRDGVCDSCREDEEDEDEDDEEDLDTASGQ